MSEPANTELPEYLQRKLAGLCTRCGEPAAPDALLCQAHLEDQRARTQRSNKKRRALNRRKGKCADCGAKSRRYRCPRCSGRSGNKPTRSEHKTEQLWREDPGTSWNRYRGKGRRGRLTREAQIDEDIRDAGFAVAEVRKFIEGLEGLKDPLVPGMPPIQREALKRKAGSFAAYAARILDDLADKYGSTKG